ncbi:MAG: CHAT domain-containing protein, partial [Spirulina sp. SIO3F2]|nr:CHAT domain-containing protein [Spirulina sp. SIO3F2]
EVMATGGNIAIAAIPGERRVRLNQPGNLLSLETTDIILTEGINPLSLPALLTAAPIAMDTKVIDSGTVVLGRTVQGAAVDLYAVGQVEVNEADSIQGETRVIRFTETGENPEQAVFIDARADNPEDLLYGVEAGTVAQIIERDEDGVAVVSEQLAVISESVGKPLKSVAIVAEGNEGNFWLGNQWLRSENIASYQQQLQRWGDGLAENADLLLYSCFTALGVTGEAFVTTLAEMTGADVAASVNATGSNNYGGDWHLETSHGEIEAENPFSTATLANWQGKLAMRTVSSSADAGAGTLRDALTVGAGFGGALAAGDTVNFNFSGTITLTGAEIAWTANDVTIDGSGQNVAIDGNGNDRVFNIGANNATIESLTITNGTVTGFNDGGGILHNGSGVLTVSNSTISGHSTSNYGGGIFSNGSITLTNSEISGNQAYWGGGFYSNGTLLITDSMIANNSVTGRGGGLFNQTGNITIDRSIISGNSAIDQGGGLDNVGALTLTQSTISNNDSGSYGGGVYNSFGAVIVQGSTVSGNYSRESGGGIYTRNAPTTITNSTISGNSARQDGGGIHSRQPVTIRNSTIAFNSADVTNGGFGDGGGIYIDGNHNNQIINTIIANNSDPSGEAPDISANLSSSTVHHNLIQSTSGISAGVPTAANGNILGQDPLLAPLANNGGLTQTHALQPGSPALDAGDNTFVSTFDQAGQTRIANDTVDLGAFEVQVSTDASASSSSKIMMDMFPLDYIPLEPLNILELAKAATMSRDRIAALLANGQICAAAAALDQYQTQAFNQYFGRLQVTQPKTCAELQQQLPNDAALLYLFAQTDKVHLIAMRAEGELMHYEQPISRVAVIEQVIKMQHTITNPVLRRSEAFLDPAQKLYQWLIEPLLSELETHDIHSILFSLDEELRMLPIAALHDGQQFLLENYQASLIPSLSLTPTHRSQLANASVLAFGISAFEQFASLPAVPVELASIKAQFPDTASFVEEQATLRNFQRQLRQLPSQVVHLATHGNFRPGQIQNSYIQFWDGQLNLRQIEQIDWHQNILELLVLSACQTALGDPAVEYGFAGLAVQAEARAAVAGLWSAHDVATLALMREFYRQLGLGQPKGEALRQAQLALLNGTVRLRDKQLVGVSQNMPLPQDLQALGDRTFWHPYYWSAFTLIGNPW